MTDSIDHAPNGRWEFNATVTDVFDDMLARSIPQYDAMREAVVDVAARYVADGSEVIDLGCSRGEALARLRDRVGAERDVRWIGVEVSEPMLAAARARFADAGDVHIDARDLRTWRGLTGEASVVLAVLTLQFAPINYRQQIVRAARRSLAEGGAMIVVEKVLGRGADVDAMMVDLYHAMKVRHGYSDEAVRRKALALEGVLVPVTAGYNEQLLRDAGFREVDCFWRWMNFAAWVALA